MHILTDEAAEPVSSEHVVGRLWVPEVGPGSLTSGDRWSDMIPACRCGCYACRCVLFALEVSDRYLHVLGVTGHPDGPL